MMERLINDEWPYHGYSFEVQQTPSIQEVYPSAQPITSLTKDELPPIWQVSVNQNSVPGKCWIGSTVDVQRRSRR